MTDKIVYVVQCVYGRISGIAESDAGINEILKDSKFSALNENQIEYLDRNGFIMIGYNDKIQISKYILHQ